MVFFHKNIILSFEYKRLWWVFYKKNPFIFILANTGRFLWAKITHFGHLWAIIALNSIIIRTFLHVHHLYLCIHYQYACINARIQVPTGDWDRVPSYMSGQNRPASITASQLGHLGTSSIPSIGTERDGGASRSIKKLG